MALCSHRKYSTSNTGCYVVKQTPLETPEEERTSRNITIPIPTASISNKQNHIEQTSSNKTSAECFPSLLFNGM